ncbi:mechanosensitive ion channel family protein [Utexia brackfieldae]|uniref:mechanosensitive ion channel family protein n=1 Tax=Utexia brackfieldae TaxID=3074108 RepID=UPI00370DA036
MNWIESFKNIIEGHVFWLVPLLLVISLVVISKLLSCLLNFFEKKGDFATNGWRIAILNATKVPLIMTVWLVGIIIAVRHYFPSENEYSALYKIISPTQKIVFIVLLSWFLFRLIHNVQSYYLNQADSQETNIDRTAVDAISKITTVIVFLIMVLGIIQALGISITGLLAFGGAAGIAVGFAAQNLVSNLFGGLTVFASRIFKINDDIIIKDADLSGKVIHIGWRSTTIEGWDGKRIYVPNSVFNTHNLINNSRLTHRTLSQDILLSYSDYSKIQDVVEEGNKWLSMREDLSYFVFRFSEFGQTALKINLYAWVKSVPGGDFVPYGEFAKAQEEILIALADIAHQKGCHVLPINHVLINEFSNPNG